MGRLELHVVAQHRRELLGIHQVVFSRVCVCQVLWVAFALQLKTLLCIAAPLYFGSGSVRSIHEKSWSALLASSCVASRSCARVSKGRCFSELVPLRSPDSDPSSSEQRSCAAEEMFGPARDSACVLSICQSQEQSLNFGSQSLILRH